MVEMLFWHGLLGRRVSGVRRLIRGPSALGLRSIERPPLTADPSFNSHLTRTICPFHAYAPNDMALSIQR